MSEDQITIARDHYSDTLRRLLDNPSAVSTPGSTINTQTLLGHTESWIVKTVRTDGKDTAFIQQISAAGSQRIVLPPAVTAALGRQREALSAKLRRQAARRAADTRKQRGIEPAFLKAKK